MTVVDPADAPAIANPEAVFSRVNPQPEPKIFTKFADVKSRIAWTPERRNILQQMWENGDNAPKIAAVLGVGVGAVNVARARFGLKPRRAVSGRPRQEPDEPAHKITRVAFATSRLAEYCSEKELVAQTGHESHAWLLVIIKELVDNAEETGVAPVITITIMTKSGKPTRIVVEDNGSGIPAETVAGIIDYDVRISSREAYVSPTRGRQGNALKSILPMGYVIGGKIKGETWIEARGVKYRIIFAVNRVRQEPVVDNIRSRSDVTSGTRITVFWPAEIIVDEDDSDKISELTRQFIWTNPHVSMELIVDGKTMFRHDATEPNWSKYRACDATSAHWYTLEQFERYAGALLDHDQQLRKKHPKRTRAKLTVRDLVAQFRGLSATEKQKQILRELGAAHMSLARFFGSETEAQSPAHEETFAVVAETHPTGAAGIAWRHWRGAFASIECEARRRVEELQIFFESRPFRRRTAVSGRDCNLPFQKMGSRRNRSARQDADHRRQFQRHTRKSVPELQGHGGHGRDSGRAARRLIRAGHRVRALRLSAHRISGSRQEPHWPGVRYVMTASHWGGQNLIDLAGRRSRRAALWPLACPKAASGTNALSRFCQRPSLALSLRLRHGARRPRGPTTSGRIKKLRLCSSAAQAATHRRYCRTAVWALDRASASSRTQSPGCGDVVLPLRLRRQGDRVREKFAQRRFN
jgi:hypothetical protein